MRKIPIKNYIFLAIISIITFVLLAYLTDFYRAKREYENSTNIRMGFLKEIHIDDFENYITENPDIVLYISNSDNTELEDLEKNLKIRLIKLEYNQDVVYLNSKNISDDFIERLRKKFDEEIKNHELNGLPNVVIIKNGFIQKYYYINSNSKASDIIGFIKYNFYEE